MIRLLAPLALLLPAPALAGPVTIDVRGADGRPLAGAVVSVETPRAAAPVPHGPYAIEQRNIAFAPHVLIVPVGATVAFPNRDKVRHHVYSFSKPKTFDLKLYGREEQRTVAFDKPGVVALGCNIHDAMSGFLIVVATPFAVQSDGAGRVSFANVPPGGAIVRVWHPSIRAPGNTQTQPLTIGAATVAATIAIRR